MKDARIWLDDARDTFHDPVERVAVEEFLRDNLSVTVVPSVLPDGRTLWLFSGEKSQLAIPFDLLPDLTKSAREDGILEKYLAEFMEEVQALVAAVRTKFFPEPCS